MVSHLILSAKRKSNLTRALIFAPIMDKIFNGREVIINGGFKSKSKYPLYS